MERMNDRIAKIASQRAASRAARPPAGGDVEAQPGATASTGARKPPAARPRPSSAPASRATSAPKPRGPLPTRPPTTPAQESVVPSPATPTGGASARADASAPRAPLGAQSTDQSGSARRDPAAGARARAGEEASGPRVATGGAGSTRGVGQTSPADTSRGAGGQPGGAHGMHTQERPVQDRRPQKPRAEELNAAPILELPRRPRTPHSGPLGGATADEPRLAERTADYSPTPLVRTTTRAEGDDSLVSLRDALREFRARLEAQRAAAGASPQKSHARKVAPPADADVCPICGGAGYLRQDLPPDDPFFGQPVPCVCKERELEEKRRRQLDRFFSLQPFADKTFESFNPSVPGTREAFEVAGRYASDPMGWLVLSGGYGCGKTHLAAAIAHHRLAVGSSVFFAVVPDLLDHLRAAFAPTSEVPYDTMFDTIREVQLLVLDDLGAENGTAWASEKLFQLINYRYNFRMPTVITTNNQLQSRMDERIRSRLADLSFVQYLVIKAGDYRPRNARRKMQ